MPSGRGVRELYERLENEYRTNFHDMRDYWAQKFNTTSQPYGNCNSPSCCVHGHISKMLRTTGLKRLLITIFKISPRASFMQWIKCAKFRLARLGWKWTAGTNGLTKWMRFSEQQISWVMDLSMLRRYSINSS